MFSENYTLPLSHDEFVHGKGSIVEKMPGDDWQRFANTRLLLANQWTQPGKKLLFMGAEFAQRAEWNHDTSLDWHLLEHAPHRGVQRLVEQLNRVYREFPALHQLDCEPAGFQWIDAGNAHDSLLMFMRKSRTPGEEVIVVFNNTPLSGGISPWACRSPDATARSSTPTQANSADRASATWEVLTRDPCHATDSRTA